MRTQQLIAVMRQVAVSVKTIYIDPKGALLRTREKIHYNISKLPSWNREFDSMTFVACMVVSLCVLGLLAEYPLEAEDIGFEEAGLFDTDSYYTPEESMMDLADMNNEELAKEALLWLSILKSYDDFSLTNNQMMLKYKNMSVAYTILSSTADGPLRRKYWSEEAVKYGRLSMGVIEGMIPDKDLGEWEEIKTRVLIAMAINYYEDGKTERLELIDQFEKISKSFLVRTGFCNNKILRALHEDDIIVLPNYFTEKSI